MGIVQFGAANLCEDCAPDIAEELTANQAQGVAEATRQQRVEQEQKTDYVSGVNMTVGGQLAAKSVGGRAPSTLACVKCKADLRSGRFCPECGGKLSGGK